MKVINTDHWGWIMIHPSLPSYCNPHRTSAPGVSSNQDMHMPIRELDYQNAMAIQCQDVFPTSNISLMTLKLSITKPRSWDFQGPLSLKSPSLWKRSWWSESIPIFPWISIFLHIAFSANLCFTSQSITTTWHYSLGRMWIFIYSPQNNWK